MNKICIRVPSYVVLAIFFCGAKAMEEKTYCLTIVNDLAKRSVRVNNTEIKPNKDFIMTFRSGESFDVSVRDGAGKYVLFAQPILTVKDGVKDAKCLAAASLFIEAKQGKHFESSEISFYFKKIDDSMKN